MPTIIPLKKMNEIVAALMHGQSFSASLGSVSNDAVWAAAAPAILNGNTLLTVPGAAANQVTVKASTMVMNVGLAGVRPLPITVDTPITSVTVLPPGARTDGTNYFFSAHDPFNEALVLLAGYYNHIYISWDVSKPTFAALGVIATLTDAVPASSMATIYIGNNSVTSARQAMCYVAANGKALTLNTYPAMFGALASVVQDAPPAYVGWDKSTVSIPSNTIQVQFTFPAGVATGTIGEVSVVLGPDIIAYMPISPQLLKDSDIPFVLTWNLMVGEPAAFS